MSPHPSDSPSRLRAAVRVIWSPGIWSAVGAQFALLVLLRWSGDQEEQAPLIRLALLTITFFVFFYLVIGVSQALARTRDAVGVGEAVHAGGEVYGRFLWLALKAALLSLVLINLGFSVALALSGREPQELFEASLGIYPWIGALIALLFVYWMPIVFVEQRFALIETLRAAVSTLARHPSDVPFLAALTLTPLAVVALLGEAPPFYLVALINIAGSLLGWIAYGFCVERLHIRPRAAVS